MWPGAASHELLEIFGQASAIFLVSWAKKKVHIRSWETFKKLRGSHCRASGGGLQLCQQGQGLHLKWVTCVLKIR